MCCIKAHSCAEALGNMCQHLLLQDMRKRKAGLEVKERHGQTCVPGALMLRVDTLQAALSLVHSLHLHKDSGPCIHTCKRRLDSICGYELSDGGLRETFAWGLACRVLAC